MRCITITAQDSSNGFLSFLCQRLGLENAMHAPLSISRKFATCAVVEAEEDDGFGNSESHAARSCRRRHVHRIALTKLLHEKNGDLREEQISCDNRISHTSHMKLQPKLKRQER
jgi:hypothetical protein